MGMIPVRKGHTEEGIDDGLALRRCIEGKKWRGTIRQKQAGPTRLCTYEIKGGWHCRPDRKEPLGTRPQPTCTK